MTDTTPETETGDARSLLEEIRDHAAQLAKASAEYKPRGEALPSGAAGEWVIACIRAAHDVPRLLAVAEAALNLAAEWDAKGAEIWSQIEIQDCDGASAGLKAVGGTVHQNCARALRAAIAGALTGKEQADVT